MSFKRREPVAVGQSEIEDDGIVGIDLEGRARIAAEADRIDGEAGPRQRRAQDLGDANFVLYHQKSHVHYLAARDEGAGCLRSTANTASLGQF